MDDLRGRIEARLAELRQIRENLARQLVAADAIIAELKALLEDEGDGEQ